MKLKFLKFTATALSCAIMAGFAPTIPVNAVENEPKLIALTFDDGPNTTTTNEILDILVEYDAKASFFLIGNNIDDESAKTVKRAYDMGCEINNHSKSHPNMGGMSAEEIKAEVDFVDEKVLAITGEKTKFFRPPFIDTSQTMYDNIDVPFICGIDPKDYMENVTAQDRADFILNNAKDGVIVLLHDAKGNDQTVEALKIAMPQLAEQGYEFVTLTELFKRQGETPVEDMMYSSVAKYPCKNYEFHSNIFSGEATGDSGWSGWSEIGALDLNLLKSLGNTYAIEIQYSSTSAPVIALQSWSDKQLWATIQPYYANGTKACFLAEDIIAELEKNEMDYTDLDRMTIFPFGGELTMTNADILVKSGVSDTTESPENPEEIVGDINDDKQVTVADLVAMKNYLLGNGILENMKNADIFKDNKVDVFDIIELRKLIIKAK